MKSTGFIGGKTLLLWALALWLTAAAGPSRADGSDQPAAAVPPVPKDQTAPDASGARNPFPGDGPLYDTFRDVAYELRCPTCTGLSILDSDATFSVQIRDIVKEQVQAGKSKADILKYFTERYGPWILREPPAKGFNALAWGLPLALLVLGPPSVWFFVWRKRKVVSTMGVRSSEDILLEMTERLQQLRGGPARGGGIKA